MGVGERESELEVSLYFMASSDNPDIFFGKFSLGRGVVRDTPELGRLCPSWVYLT